MIDQPAIITKLEQVDLSRTSNFLKGFFREDEIRSASVVMPLICRENGWNLLFIRRTSNEQDLHSGQVAFPGGKIESEDNGPLAAALREFAEETGVPPKKLDIVGQLPQMITVTKFCITPYIAVLENDFIPHPEPSEVDRIFEIPLEWLAEEKNLIRQERDILGHLVDVIIYKEYDGETLWGASARLTEYLLQALELK